MSCRLPLPLYKALRHLAVDQGQSLNDVVVDALADFWSKHPQRSKYVHLVEEPSHATRRR